VRKRGTKGGQLGVERFDLGLGESGGELGEGPLGLLLSVKGRKASSSKPMHFKVESG